MVSDSLGLVDFADRPVNSVLSLPNGQVIFFVCWWWGGGGGGGNSNYKRTVIKPANQIFSG